MSPPVACPAAGLGPPCKRRPKTFVQRDGTAPEGSVGRFRRTPKVRAKAEPLYPLPRGDAFVRTLRSISTTARRVFPRGNEEACSHDRQEKADDPPTLLSHARHAGHGQGSLGGGHPAGSPIHLRAHRDLAPVPQPTLPPRPGLHRQPHTPGVSPELPALHRQQ